MWCKWFITHIILFAAEGLLHFGSLFYHDTQYSHLGWFTNLLWCDIPLNKAPRTGPHHIWRIYTVPFLWPREEQTTVQLGGWYRWPVFVMASLKSESIFWFRVSVSNQNFTDGLFLEFDLFPGHCNRHLQRSALLTLCMTLHSCSPNAA